MKEAKKELILNAALEVFRKKGFSKSTLKEIAEKAGIGKSTIYEYFKNKDAIINESFDYFGEMIAGDALSILWNSEERSFEKLIKIIDYYQNVVDSEKKEIFEVLFHFWAEAVKSNYKNKIIKEKMNEQYAEYRNLFTQLLQKCIEEGDVRQDIDIRSVAAVILGTLDGLMVQWITDSNFDYKTSIGSFKKIYVNGLKR